MIPPVLHASYAMILLSLLLLLPTFYFIWRARQGQELYIRRIPGIDAIDEAVGRSTELGRPIMFTTGLSGLGPLLFAVLGILSHIAKKAAAYGCRLIIPQCDYTVMPVVEETTREAYRAVGRLDQFNPQDIRYLSDQQFAFASGYMGIAHREKAATCFLFGDFAAESLILAEAGQVVGAMQVAGTPSYNQIPFFITSCDYTLIGEEVYAAGAYLSREPSQLGSVRGADAAKMVTLALIAAGLVLGTFLSIRYSDTKEGATYTSPLKEACYAAPQQARALARFEITSQYRPEAPPEHGDLEDGLTAARARLGRDARRICGALKRIAELAAAQERSIRGSLELLEAGPARAQAEQMADGLKDVATRAGEGAKYLADLTGKKLPDLNGTVLVLRRQRAVEAARTELACLDAWAARQSGPEGAACRKLLDAAEGAVAKGSAAEIERAVKSAREACYQAHLVEIRVIMDGITKAAEQATPCYLLRTGAKGAALKAANRAGVAGDIIRDLVEKGDFKALADEGLPGTVEEALDELVAKAKMTATPLVLDGEKSVSGRLLPLRFAWTVRRPGEPLADRKFAEDSKLERTLEKPGIYKLGLAVSEKQEPLTLPLALGGAERSALQHQTVAEGTPVKFTCPLAKTVVPESATIRWDLDGDGKFEKTDSAAEYTCDQPGRHVITMEAAYQERAEAGSEAKGRVAAGAAKVPGAIRSLRRRLGVTIPDIAERLADVNGRLARMRGEAAGYARPLKPLDYAKGLNQDSWPDRTMTAEILKNVEELRNWGVKGHRFLLQAAANADTLGAVPAAAPAAGEGPAEDEVQIVERFKRYRIHLEVIKPAGDETEMTVQVLEAPAFPRAPWAPPEPKPPARGAGGGK